MVDDKVLLVNPVFQSQLPGQCGYWVLLAADWPLLQNSEKDLQSLVGLGTAKSDAP